MMDGSAMFPQGFHPIWQSLLPDDTSTPAPFRPRAMVPVTYYFIDFGISCWFIPGDTDRLVLGSKGLDGEAPELSDSVPYDPFRLDMFILGNLFRKQFLDVSALFFGLSGSLLLT